MNESLDVLIQQKTNQLLLLNNGKYCKLTKSYKFFNILDILEKFKFYYSKIKDKNHMTKFENW